MRSSRFQNVSRLALNNECQIKSKLIEHGARKFIDSARMQAYPTLARPTVLGRAIARSLIKGCILAYQGCEKSS